LILERLSQLVREDGGLLADALRQDSDAPTPYGDAIASAPRAAGHTADLPLVIEAVREGYLLHYGEPRLMSREDDDLALLAGDRLYALGLDRLARLGDIEAVGELADVISLCALAQADGTPETAEAAWEAAAAAVGWGSGPEHAAAKAAARAGEPGAAASLRAAAACARGQAGASTGRKAPRG
jgi:hypothetical protein